MRVFGAKKDAAPVVEAEKGGNPEVSATQREAFETVVGTAEATDFQRVDAPRVTLDVQSRITRADIDAQEADQFASTAKEWFFNVLKWGGITTIVSGIGAGLVALGAEGFITSAVAGITFASVAVAVSVVSAFIILGYLAFVIRRNMKENKIRKLSSRR